MRVKEEETVRTARDAATVGTESHAGDTMIMFEFRDLLPRTGIPNSHRVVY